MDLNKLENPTFLIVDLETDSIDTQIAKIKFFGSLDLNTGEYIIRKWDSDIKTYVQDLIKKYTFIITFNGKNYDLPILNNHGIDLMYIRHIDLYDVFKKRKSVLFKSEPQSLSLKNLVKVLGLDTEGGKGEIDYSILQKDDWTIEEIKEIETYLKQDLKLEEKLWDYLLDKFEIFKEFVKREDCLRYKHITSTLGSYAYKVICNNLGWEENYMDDDKSHATYEGAYVMKPFKESAKGTILYFDFASLYPMMYVHANLFSNSCKCCKQEEKWHGNEQFKVNGYYCKKEQGKVEELVKSMFIKRKILKKQGNPRERVYKYVLNSMYGISAKPTFKNLYAPFLASDCTLLGRQCIEYAIKSFIKNDFTVLYADTDSCIIEVPLNKTKDSAMELANEISKQISMSFPFPWDEFNFKLEDEIKYIQFFKDSSDELKKKNYIYVNLNNEMIIKGLDIIQKDASQCSKIIFEKVIKPKIIKDLDCKICKQDISCDIISLIQ